MFSRLNKPCEEVVQRKTFEQLGMEQIMESIDELKNEVVKTREELRSFQSRFESWQDLQKLLDNVRQREVDLAKRELEIESMKMKLMETHHNKTEIKNEGNDPQVLPSGEEVDGGL